ncbi:MAG TPA: hypothetical protein VFG03_07925 [Telluria sp.]|nr:hypothetical protein [Telluria sp.]
MQALNGKVAGLVASVMVIGGLPLLAFMLLFLKLTAARNAGQPESGDAIGLAMMSALAYGIALLSFAIGVGYFGYKLARHKLYPKVWHRVVLAYSSIELAAPFVYFWFT